MPRRKDTQDTIIELLENPVIAGVVICLALIVFGGLLPEYFFAVTAIILAYLMSDIVLSMFIKGGHGIGIIPLIDHYSKHKGHTFIAFFIGIILSTLICDTLADFLSDIAKTSTEWFTLVVLFSIGLSFAVFVDLQAKFYEH
jgi:hypothetical protein